MSETDVVAKTVVVTISQMSLTSAATRVSSVIICHSMIISTDWASFRILHADTSDKNQ